MPTPTVEVLQERLDHVTRSVDEKLEKILEQTTLTNGRVNDLESWKDKIQGALIPISIISPVIAGLIVSYLAR